jgi:hypothetical protein
VNGAPRRGELWWCETADIGRLSDDKTREIGGALAVAVDCR